MKLLAISLITFLAILQYDLWLGEGSLTAAWQMENAIEQQKQENTRLQARNDALAAEVQDLKGGLAAIEERARSELGMARDKETFIQVIDGSK
jgi:cell division protein FtsB